MKKKDKGREQNLESLSFNLAILGGGKACRSFLEFLKDQPFRHVDINIVGVCDINPRAQGFCLAKEMGIYTTENLRNLFKIKELDAIIELTGSRDALLDLIRLRPQGLAVFEHRSVAFLKDHSITDHVLKSLDEQVAVEKGVSDFLIQQANERIVILNPDFTISEANDSYIKAVGKSKEEVVGAHCYKVTHGVKAPCTASHPGLGCPLVETLKTGQSAHVIHEHSHSSLDGQPTYCDMVTYPVKDRDGRIEHVIEVWRDITDQLSSRLERRINAIKDDFKKLVQEDRMISLGKLVASSVHEINNPIQGLLTFSDLMQEILRDGSPDPQDLENFKEYLSLMSRELARCGDIISGLLSFSRQSEIEYKDVDLNEILDQVLALTHHKMEIQDIQLSTRLSSAPLIINGHPNQLQQCFLNLIFNAIEVMDLGGRLTVTSDLDRAHRSVLVNIQDTGCGIPEENLGHIFDPFFTTKQEDEGIGMGLSIVYGIVKNHGGEITVASRVGKGTSFTMRFPTA